MRYVKIKSQRGFGLIQAIAGLLIVSVAGISLFISAHFAKTKAVQNNNYRLALLKAMSELEMIKWNYPNYGINPESISFYSYQFILDDRNNPSMQATLIIDKKVYNDLSISTDAKNAVITAKVEWEEPIDFFISNKTVKRSIALRDDYFYRVSQ
jgi:hypothetical protein